MASGRRYASRGDDLQFYGSSVGAVRGTIRDALRRHSDLTHDEVTALSSELWAVPVFERRLAAVVLLQSKVRLLMNSDLTRIEGFVRTARLRDLVDPLAVDVVGPLMEGLDAQGRGRADAVLDRWAGESDVWLRRAALWRRCGHFGAAGVTGTGSPARRGPFSRNPRAMDPSAGQPVRQSPSRWMKWRKAGRSCGFRPAYRRAAVPEGA